MGFNGELLMRSRERYYDNRYPSEHGELSLGQCNVRIILFLFFILFQIYLYRVKHSTIKLFYHAALFLTRHNEPMNDDQLDDLHTWNPCLTCFVYVLLMTSHPIPSCIMVIVLWTREK